MVLDSTTSTTSSTPSEELLSVTGVSFGDDSAVYDGERHEIVVSGELPAGVSVRYENNFGTDAGEYAATAILSGAGYETLTLHATLTIEKADIAGVSFSDDETVYDGKYRLPLGGLKGELPAGTTVTWYVDGEETATGVRAIGSYAVRVQISGKNYNTLTLEGTFTVKVDAEAALKIFLAAAKSFGSTPEIWSFLPDSFSPENRLLSSAVDYSSFVSVAALPTNGMGKQLNVVYGVLNKAEVALSYVNQGYAVLNTLENLYKTFLDNNPEDYTVFSGTTENGGAAFTLSLAEGNYFFSLTLGPVKVYIFSDAENETYGARVQLTENTVLKYTVQNDYLKIALDVVGAGKTQIEFVRENGVIVGYIYEYLTVADKDIVATSALLTVGKDYTYLIGSKGDFVPASDGRNCEVYRNTDGKLVGTEVRETNTVGGVSVTFNTLWYPLGAVGGITSIKKTDEANGVNADTIYINEKSDPIQTKTVGGFTLKTASRRFDIEFKTMYFWQYNAETEEYESLSSQVPMLFIQEEQAATFGSDFAEKNGVTVSLNVSSSDKEAVSYGYYTLLETYDRIKEAVTKEMIDAYLKA